MPNDLATFGESDSCHDLCGAAKARDGLFACNPDFFRGLDGEVLARSSFLVLESGSEYI